MPMCKSKHSATFGDMMVMPATKYLWAKSTSVVVLSNAVNGLFESIYMLLHPTITLAGRFQAMFRQLLNIYSKKIVMPTRITWSNVFLLLVHQQAE